MRLIDNSSDSSTNPASGPVILYDSARDPDWPNLHKIGSPSPSPPSENGRGRRSGSPDGSPPPGATSRTGRGINEPGWVDAKGFVHGELVQGEDGRVHRRRRGGSGQGEGDEEAAGGGGGAGRL